MSDKNPNVESSESSKVSFTTQFDPGDPSIQDIFVDEASILIHLSSASILLGVTLPGAAEGKTIKPLVRVHMTHDTLARFVTLLNSRVEALRELYGSTNPSLSNHTWEEINSIIRKHSIEKVIES